MLVPEQNNGLNRMNIKEKNIIKKKYFNTTLYKGKVVLDRSYSLKYYFRNTFVKVHYFDCIQNLLS